MMNVRVFKTTHDLDDRLHLANVMEKLIAKAFPRTGALHEAGDVYKFDRR